MADWSKFTGTGDTYASIPGYEDGKDDDAVSLNDTRRAAATSLPDYAKRWNNTLSVFQNWLSSAWSTIVLAIAGGGTGATTTSGARANLDVYSRSQVDSAIDADVATHAAFQSAGVHGGTSAATANKLMQRDSAGRAKVATPNAPGDIATYDWVLSLIPDGTYSPTGSVVSGASTITPGTFIYMRVGDTVHVTGRMQILSTGTFSVVDITLPIASDFTTPDNASGTASGFSSGTSSSGYVTAESIGNKARVSFANTVSGQLVYLSVSFSYRVL